MSGITISSSELIIGYCCSGISLNFPFRLMELLQSDPLITHYYNRSFIKIFLHAQNEELNSSTMIADPPSENIQQSYDVEIQSETKKKRKKKKKTKRNQTAPSDDGENSDAGIVLKPIAWKTPPPSLNGFPASGRKLEPIRPPLHNSKLNNIREKGFLRLPITREVGILGTS